MIDNWINNVMVSNGLADSPLEINDLNKLKITKIKYCKIFFKYDGVRYFILENYDCGDQWFSLYRKEFIDGKCIVNQVSSSGWMIADICDLLDKKDLMGCRVYSHMDKEYFVNKLRENNLIK